MSWGTRAGLRTPPGVLRLLFPALLAWGVAAPAVTLPGSGSIVGIGAGALGAALIGAAVARPLRVGERYRSRFARGRAADRRADPSPATGRLPTAALRVGIVSCAVLLLLGARIAGAEAVRGDPGLAAAARSGQATTLSVRLAGYPVSPSPERGGRGWVRATIETPSGKVPAVLWFDGAPADEWHPGTSLRLITRVERLAAASSAAYGLPVREFVEEGERTHADLGDWPPAVRLGLRRVAEKVPGAELVPGLAVGDTALVEERLDATMRDSSLTHLTAVSGANCALVTGAFTALLARFGAGRRTRVTAAAAGLLGFVVLVGPDPSVLRAALMAAVMLVSSFGGKRGSALPALGLAMLVLLLADPWQAVQAGFALSVAATGGILAIGGPCTRWLRGRLRIPKPLALPVAVAFAAQAFCGPILILLHPGIPAVGVVANVIAGPAAPLGTGLGLVGGLLAPLAPGAAQVLVVLAALPASWIAATAEVAANLPLGRWHWPPGWPGAALLAACELACAAAWALRRGHLAVGAMRARPRSPWLAAPTRPRRIAWLSTVLAWSGVGAFVAASAAAPLASRLGVPHDWVVVACDVGQGDAILLRDPTSPGAVMLVDTGDEPERLTACLDRFGVSRIALLVLTHDDRDHVGALDTIVTRVDAALVAPDNLDDLRSAGRSGPVDRAPLRTLERAGVPIAVGTAGQAGGLGPAHPSTGLRWRLLAPAATPIPADSNAASLVLRVDAGGMRILLLADTGREEQEALLGRLGHGAAGELGAQVLKVAHHGSRDQEQRLPELVGASWALISVGAENRFGHPTDETVAALLRAGTTPLRTDQLGSIAVRAPRPGDAGASGGTPPEAWAERGVG